jgi:hypothetical protein
MSHLPVNHHLRPLYRVLAGLAGLYVLLFGIVGLVETSDSTVFGRDATYALGLKTNLAFSVLSIVVGAIVLIGVLIGRNIDRAINLFAGIVFLGAGLVMLTVMETEANILNFSVSTCVVSFVIGLVLFTAGLYGRVGSRARASAEESFRHGAPEVEERQAA